MIALTASLRINKPTRARLALNSHSKLPQSTQSIAKHSLKSIKSILLLPIFNLLNMQKAYASSYSLKSDEIEVNVPTEFLGLSLKEMKIGKDNNNLVIIQAIKPEADILLQQVIKPGMIITNIGDIPVEGYSGKELVNVFKSMTKPTKLILRDPDLFFKRLDSTQLFPTNLLVEEQGEKGKVHIIVENTNSQVLETSINFATNETLRVQRLQVRLYYTIPYYAHSYTYTIANDILMHIRSYILIYTLLLIPYIIFILYTLSCMYYIHTYLIYLHLYLHLYVRVYLYLYTHTLYIYMHMFLNPIT